MSKYNNVKPDHFKTAGREPQGRDVVHDVQRQQFAESKVREKRDDPGTGHQDVAAPPSPDTEGRQGVSSKKGKRSSAKKMQSTRHNLDSIPATSKTPGASGEEGDDTTPKE
jgi:hypothetical protein